ncbi:MULTISPECIES: hypothetical protein [unclassified Microbacterium]|uniref:hypothetical protein n=1 Tax=unclassified Microbacterium TaxID=2609290 RepID=UPI000EE067C4|nr:MULTISPECIES: hypothetical protein [unclassified Microbacterium]MBT2484847.1 hypothetical protein [Microbacterium sp. ISL-108]RKN67717.1 hypothetical protein D7252_09020 [Microbacterium sp. CGR2]
MILKVLAARIFRATIWHPDAIPAGVDRDATSAELKRYVLPYFDGVLIVMAILAIKLGMPSFDIVLNSEISSISSWTLLVASVSAAFGLIFPRFWYLEGAGKLLMLFVLGGYAAALWTLVFQGVGDRGVVACAFTALLAFPMWTLWRINRERRKQDAQDAVVAAAIAQVS